jgi:hypothetical protein
MLAALALRAALVVAFPVGPVWDGAIYARAADHIAYGVGYTRAALDPDQPREPTAFYPVGFPALLAPLRWLGVGRNLDLAFQVALGALSVVLAGLLGRRAGGARVGRTAAWLVALWPGGVLLSASWLSEPAFTALVALGCLPIAYARRRASWRPVVLAALVLGLAALVRPTALPILVALAVGLALVRGRPATAGSFHAAWPRLGGRVGRVSAQVGAHVAVALVVAALVLAPWALRNAVALDGPAPISTNAGANLLVGARGEGTFARLPDELHCSPELPEVARDRCRTRLALERIADAPLAWLARGGLKLAHTFGHESAPAQAWGSALLAPVPQRETAALLALALTRGFWLLFAPAALAGAVLLRRSPRRASPVTVALLAPLVGVAALHFVFLGGDRYHAPVVPMMAVLAALALEALRAPAPVTSALSPAAPRRGKA